MQHFRIVLVNFYTNIFSLENEKISQKILKELFKTARQLTWDLSRDLK